MGIAAIPRDEPSTTAFLSRRLPASSARSGRLRIASGTLRRSTRASCRCMAWRGDHRRDGCRSRPRQGPARIRRKKRLPGAKSYHCGNRTQCISSTVSRRRILSAYRGTREIGRRNKVVIPCRFGALGSRIPDRISPPVSSKSRRKIEDRLKTASPFPKIDLHLVIGATLKVFAGERWSGFLFCTRNGKPLGPSNILRRRLHSALKKLGLADPATGTHKLGNHAFRRFRNTHLPNRTQCPEGLQEFCLRHTDEIMDDNYNNIEQDLESRKVWAEKCAFGFKPPSVVPNVPKIGAEALIEIAV